MKKATKPPTKTQLRTATNQSKAVISEWVKNSRTNLQLSQEGLAEIAGVDRKTINRIENGHFSPSIDTLVRISVSLNSKIPSLV
jgi:DNA-binding XRE family transcriptional regulator